MTGFFLLCALPPEAAAAKAGLLLHNRSGRVRRSSVDAAPRGRVRVVGMGPSRARNSCSRLASSLPVGAPVIVLGVGGALVGGLAPGTLVVADSVGTADVPPGHDELQVVTMPEPLDSRSAAFGASLAEALGERFVSTTRAPVLTATRVARGRERAKLAESGAIVCDTESAALMRLGVQRPFAVVRAVVDSPEQELLSLLTISGGMRGLKRLADAAAIIAGVLERQPMTAAARSIPSALAPPPRQPIPSAPLTVPTES